MQEFFVILFYKKAFTCLSTIIYCNSEDFMPSYKKKIIIKVCFYSGLLGFLLLLIFIPGAGLCPYSRFFGMKCPACGATRCLFSLLCFDIKSAVSYNPVFALGIYPVLFLTAGLDFLQSLINLIKKRDEKTLFDFFSTL